MSVVNRVVSQRENIFLLCRRCYHIMDNRTRIPQHYKKTEIGHVSKRTITFNEAFATRGDVDYHATGFALEKGLQEYGTFEGMEEFMSDKLPDFAINVVSVLPEISLTNPWPTTIVAHAFDNLQYITNLPWFATIAVFGIIVKIGLYPFHVWWRKDFQNHVQKAPIQVGVFLQTYFSNIFQHGSVESMYKAYEAREKTCNDLNIPTFPSLFPIYATTLLPAISLLGLSYLTNLTYEPLLTGGMLWFQNLAEPDPYLLLPIINSLLIIGNARLHPLGFLLPWPVIAYGFKFQSSFAVLTCLQVWFSSAFMIYCISANSVGLIIQILLRTETIRSQHGLLNMETVLAPFLEQSKAFGQIGGQIGDTKRKLIEAVVAHEELLNEPKLQNVEENLLHPKKESPA